MPEATEPKTRDFSEAAKSLESAISTEEPENPVEEKPEEETSQPEPEAAKPEAAPPPKDHDAENAERTRLGRRVKKLEELIGDLVTEIKQSRTPAVPPPEIPETISTPEDVQKVIDARERVKTERQQTYHNNYRKAIDILGEENSDVHAEVMSLIEVPNSPFNHILSEDPYADAERNYYRAVKAVLKKKAVPVKPKVGVKGEKPIAPTGVPTGTTVDSPAAKPQKIDDFARSFMQRMNISDEKAGKMLR